MRLKRKNAQTMLDFCKSRIESNNKKFNAHYTDLELELYGKVKTYNRVGISVGG